MPGSMHAAISVWMTCPSRLPRRASWASCNKRLSETERSLLPVPGGSKDRIRVGRLAAAAVVSAQCHEQVTAFAIDVVAQDHAAKAQVGLHVKQPTGIAIADHPRPE